MAIYAVVGLMIALWVFIMSFSLSYFARLEKAKSIFLSFFILWILYTMWWFIKSYFIGSNPFSIMYYAIVVALLPVMAFSVILGGFGTNLAAKMRGRDDG